VTPRAKIARETEAYAAYLNAPRGVLAPEEDELLEQDTARARAAMERAWLDEIGVTTASGVDGC
jgi:hypothetical protein